MEKTRFRIRCINKVTNSTVIVRVRASLRSNLDTSILQRCCRENCSQPIYTSLCTLWVVYKRLPTLLFPSRDPFQQWFHTWFLFALRGRNEPRDTCSRLAESLNRIASIYTFASKRIYEALWMNHSPEMPKSPVYTRVSYPALSPREGLNVVDAIYQDLINAITCNLQLKLCTEAYRSSRSTDLACCITEAVREITLLLS